MLNNIRTIEKMIKEENSKVIGAVNSSRIKKQGREREDGSKAFEESLYQAKKQKKTIETEDKNKHKETIDIQEDAVVIASSLERLIEEHKIIEEEVEKRFSKYSYLKKRISEK